MDYKIGIIDDDDSKITQMLTYLKLGWEDEDGKIIKEKYRFDRLLSCVISLEKDINEMVTKICSMRIDAIIIDYKLSSQKNISYLGVQLAQEIDKNLAGFPIFILTSYQDDLYEKENFDAYQVFDFERYINDIDERIEINSKIVEQIKKYNATLNQWRGELIELLPKLGQSVSIDNRIIELDSLIERSMDGSAALPEKTKQELLDSNHIQLLINKLDEIMD